MSHPSQPVPPLALLPTRSPWAVAFVVAFSLLLLTACGGDVERTADDPVAAETSGDAAGDAATDASEEVTYEPAYPEDVSPEGLSEEDAAQQQQVHSHGGEPHAHDEEEEHGEHGDDGHEHEDGADDHPHPGDGGAHGQP